MHRIILLLLLLTTIHLSAQEYGIDYYLPADISYDPTITTPAEFLGHEIGEWHATHDKLYYYMRQLAMESERIILREHARSHEDRPLIHLIVTSTENHKNLEEIRIEHKKLTDPEVSPEVNIDELPVVIYQGSTIHGNEASGANGAIATAYYLAAAQGPEIDRLLDEAIILFDPVFNPDGMQRFSTWVNTHKGDNLITDPDSREYNEVWPRGRTNHYWFDLNRDWLLLTHPESQGRIKTFHEWKPDILTDHHEMGSNSTFFFQPGIPSRTNPNTPALNQELTAAIGRYHAAALDEIGSLYYTKESYDDYYYGKGSTYPDIQGCIGILFEQASSRGHLQETDHGLLSFPFTIRNQVRTMLSTQKAGVELRKELLEYKRRSFLEAEELAKKNNTKAYVFGEPSDPARVNRFIDIMRQHQIEIYELAKDHGQFKKGEAYVVPMQAAQYRLIKTIFEPVREYQDSLFYDVSAWTMPFAFDIPYTTVSGSIGSLQGDILSGTPSYEAAIKGDTKAYAYLIPWQQYYAPNLLSDLLEEDVIVKLANEPFDAYVSGELMSFSRGTIIVPVGNNQGLEAEALRDKLAKAGKAYAVDIYATQTGEVGNGVNLGSRSSDRLYDPQVAMIIGSGINSYDAGEIWHHFDQVMDMAVPMLDITDMRGIDLNKYKTLIFPDGNYNALNSRVNDLKDWCRAGGTIIAMKGSINWLKQQGLLSTNYKEIDSKKDGERLPYHRQNEDQGAKRTGGMIANVHIDTSHPLYYGYERDQSYVFKRGNDYFEYSKDAYDTPAAYTGSPVASGYMHPDNVELLSNSAAVWTENVGKGRVIAITHNPVFRGYWWGGSKFFANAVFFGQIIN